MGDKDIRNAWDKAADTFLEMLSASPSRFEQGYLRYKESHDELISILQERAAGLAHVLGIYISEWLEAMFLTQFGLPVPKNLATRVQHFAPDNPLEIQPDGDVRHATAAGGRHYQQLRDYYRSRKPTSGPGRPPVSVPQALRVYQMAQEGKHWSEIALAEFPDYDHYDPMQKERMRKKIDRLRERGAIESSRND